MKILFSAEDFYPRLGGGEAFIDEFLTELSKKNEVHVIYVGKKKESRLILHPIKDTYALKHIPIFNRTIIRQYLANRKWGKIVEEKINEIKPDIIVTQLIYTPSTIEISKKHNIPSVVFIHNYEHFCPVLFRERDTNCKRNCFSCLPLSYKIQYPFYKWLVDWHAKALRDASMILPDTEFIVRLARKFYNVQATAFYPIVDLARYKTQKKESRYITLVNPAKHKGFDIFNAIAERMPDYEFLIVCGKDPKVAEKIKNLKNITYLAECEDIRKAYAKTRILLAPSTWPEPFGRVVLEAQINGIPCIVSPLGGLPEVVGDGGFVVNDLYNINEWIDKIKRLGDKKTYNDISKKAVRHASKYTVKSQIDKFNRILREIKKG